MWEKAMTAIDARFLLLPNRKLAYYFNIKDRLVPYMERGSSIPVKNKWIAQILNIDNLVGTREANDMGKCLQNSHWIQVYLSVWKHPSYNFHSFHVLYMISSSVMKFFFLFSTAERYFILLSNFCVCVRKLVQALSLALIAWRCY